MVTERASFGAMSSPDRFVDKSPSQIAGRLFAEASRKYPASVNAQAAYIAREHRKGEISHPLFTLMAAGQEDHVLMEKLANMANVAHREVSHTAGKSMYVHLEPEAVSPVFGYSFSKAITLSELEISDLDFIMHDMYPRYSQMPLVNGSSSKRENKYSREIRGLLWQRRFERWKEHVQQSTGNLWGRRLRERGNES